MARQESAVRQPYAESAKSGPSTDDSPESDIRLTLNRIINAPLDEVYAAWTNPEILKKWFAPGDAEVKVAVANVIVGGTLLVEIRASDGTIWRILGVYREVEPLRRLVHTWAWEGSSTESLVAVDFEPTAPGKTLLTLTHSRFEQTETRDEHERGWSGCLSKLEKLLV